LLCVCCLFVVVLFVCCVCWLCVVVVLVFVCPLAVSLLQIATHVFVWRRYALVVLNMSTIWNAVLENSISQPVYHNNCVAHLKIYRPSWVMWATSMCWQKLWSPNCNFGNEALEAWNMSEEGHSWNTLRT